MRVVDQLIRAASTDANRSTCSSLCRPHCTAGPIDIVTASHSVADIDQLITGDNRRRGTGIRQPEQKLRMILDRESDLGSLQIKDEGIVCR